MNRTPSEDRAREPTPSECFCFVLVAVFAFQLSVNFRRLPIVSQFPLTGPNTVKIRTETGNADTRHTAQGHAQRQRERGTSDTPL
eukprot:3963758-Prymnesium_polylepis.1